ncbi:MAG: PQQ-binding-like beta-propeller repeat protein [Terriglobia bacterium]
MRRNLALIALTCMLLRAADWPTVGGSPQRDGWAKSETAFTKDNVKGLELLYKFKAGSAPSTPMVLGRLITYLGFKEMLVFADSSDSAYSLDADLNRAIWKAHFSTEPVKTPAVIPEGCRDLMPVPIAMAGSSTAVVARTSRPAPGAVATPVRRPARGGEFFAVSSDGYLHIVNPSTGEDRAPAMQFVPPNSKVSALNISDNVVYAATLDGCGGKADSMYALDLASDANKVVAQPAQGGSIVGSEGSAIGQDGFVYAQARNLNGGNDAVFALQPKTLAVNDYFLTKTKITELGPGATPVIFNWAGSEVIAAGGSDGRLFLLDPKAMKVPLFESEPIAAGGFHNAFASWEDPEKLRWLYASSAAGVIGFRVEDRSGKPVLTKVWASAALASASAPVIANGVVFVLASNGLNALDASTGKMLYNSGRAITSPARGGLAIANRRIYFSTQDNNVYCFGFLAEQPQLTGK